MVPSVVSPGGITLQYRATHSTVICSIVTREGGRSAVCGCLLPAVYIDQCIIFHRQVGDKELFDGHPIIFLPLGPFLF